MKTSTKFQLSFMMFLEFFVWGSWFVTMGTHLGQNLDSSGGEVATAYMTQAWGAIVAPFVIGLIADRFFAAQKLLGVLHLSGTVLLFLMAQTNDFSVFYPYVLTYMLIYMPTLALVNSVAFNQMKDPSKQFASVRFWGTIGWIVQGVLIGYVLLWESKDLLESTFMLAASVSVFLGVYSFTLPNTPPRAKGQKADLKQIVGADALALLKDKNYLIFFVSSILICIPLAFYYSFANPFLNEVGMPNAAGNMSLGQVSEALLLLLLPIFLKRFGLKITLLVGMLAWVLRYALFAFGDAGPNIWMLFIGIVLHGICYDFFFVSGQIFTDFKAGKEIRSAAQGLITLATYGVGMLIGFKIAGIIVDNYTLLNGEHDWTNIWLIPSAISAVVLVFFLLTFKNEKIVLNN
ncbi:MAG: MFS transporter [Muricauda sp.]|nr:nucleoside permease [Allomuricauda sp.]MBC30503.1 MFS transporter [Allomuricauda sp.]|tara:strand:+ start:228 stop:1439 length:1212 start_codon:yes stop_codon:yes gene_type:complete